jgi:hypothetical protein
LVYIHPIFGGAVLALLLYTAALGLRSRGRSRLRASLLARHARLAPVCFVLVAAAWIAGLLSTAVLRHDLEIARSTHFLLGTALLAVLGGSYWSSRAALAGGESARELHAWLGVAATLLAFAQAFTGLRITP